VRPPPFGYSSPTPTERPIFLQLEHRAMSTDGRSAISAPSSACQGDKDDAQLEQLRVILRRFGAYAACTAPTMMVLMASRQSEAGSGGAKGGGCGFSC
jgi:hypothetical protein